MRTFAYIFSIALIALAISLAVPACSTIVNGTHEEVQIMANPTDAEISVDGMDIGKGSAEFNLERGSKYYVEVKKDGYITTVIRTGVGVAGWYWGNFLGFSIYGMIADLFSKAAFSIEPNPILVVLSKGSGKPIVEDNDTNGYLLAILPVAIVLALTVWFTVEISRGYP